MTRKDYEIIATAIGKLSDNPTKAEVAVGIGTALQTDNPRFDSGRWYRWIVGAESHSK